MSNFSRHDMGPNTIRNHTATGNNTGYNGLIAHLFLLRAIIAPSPSRLLVGLRLQRRFHSGVVFDLKLAPCRTVPVPPFLQQDFAGLCFCYIEFAVGSKQGPAVPISQFLEPHGVVLMGETTVDHIRQSRHGCSGIGRVSFGDALDFC